METLEGEIGLTGMDEEGSTGENHVEFSIGKTGGIIWVFEIRAPTPITNATTG